jgi:hypothetical protein
VLLATPVVWLLWFRPQRGWSQASNGP